LTNFQKKRGAFEAKKNKLGLSLRRKKIGEKLTNFQKQKWLELIF